MKNVLISLVIAATTIASMEACVTYSPSTNTYTVDHQGCVQH